VKLWLSLAGALVASAAVRVATIEVAFVIETDRATFSE
jgi:hypothetical protein